MKEEKKYYQLINGDIIIVPAECSFLNKEDVQKIYENYTIPTKWDCSFTKFIKNWMYNTIENFELISPIKLEI